METYTHILHLLIYDSTKLFDHHFMETYSKETKRRRQYLRLVLPVGCGLSENPKKIISESVEPRAMHAWLYIQ